MCYQHRRHRRRDRPRLLGALATALTVGAGLVALVAPSRPAQASPVQASTAVADSAPILGPGRLVSFSDPGVALVRPADGRLVGSGFSAVVLGAAVVRVAGTGARVRQAPAGMRLEVFSLLLRSTDDRSGQPAGLDLAMAVQAGAERLALPGADMASPGYHTYALAVAPRAAVSLVSSDQGVDQSFSLTAGRRLQPEVTAYYRNPAGPALVDQVASTQTLVGTDPSDGFQAATAFSVSSASLSYLSPLGTPASAPSQAFVVLKASDDSINNASGYNCGYFAGFAPLPVNRIHLVLPSGASVAASYTGPTTAAILGSGLLQGTFYFPAPADLTTAKVVMSPGTLAGVHYYPSCTGDPATVSYAGSATFALSFPVLPPPPPAPLPASFTVSLPGSVPGSSSPTGTAGGGGPPWPWLALLIPLAGGGALLARRRRRVPQPDTVPWAPGTDASTAWPPPPSPGNVGPSPSPAMPSAPPPDPAPATDFPAPQPDPSTADPAPRGPLPAPPRGPLPTPPRDSPPTPPRGQPPAPDHPTTGNGTAVAAANGSREAATPAPPAPPAPGQDRVPDGIAVPSPPDPAARSEGHDGVEVKVLGAVEVVGWAQAPQRRRVTELLAYLALHPGRRLSGDELRAHLWPLDDDGREASAETLHSYVSFLRRALGRPEHLPEAGSGGYQLGPGVTSDWARFQGLVGLSDQAPSGETGQAIGHLRAALSLVRGAPLAGTAPRTYEWASAELFPSAMATAIVDAAHRLALLDLQAKQAKDAAWAARQGLLAWPSFAPLHADLLEAVAARGDRQLLERTWKDTQEALRDDELALADLARLHDDLHLGLARQPELHPER